MRIPKGFREYSPSIQEKFDSVLLNLCSILKNKDFSRIDTPAVELTEILYKDKEIKDHKNFFVSNSDKNTNELCLRYDLTVPFARYIVDHKEEIILPFRRFQYGKVYRGERPQKGRMREFWQFDVDIAHKPSDSYKCYDIEILEILNELLTKLLNDRFILKISHTKLLTELLAIFENKNAIEIKAIIDDKFKLPKDVYLNKLSSLCDKELLDLFDQLYNSTTQYDLLRDFSLESLHSIPLENLDIHIVRGLDYYTGMVFECFLKDDMNLGSICSGGRYDNLAPGTSGVGFSVGLSRLFEFLLEKDMVISPSKFPIALFVSTSEYYYSKLKTIQQAFEKLNFGYTNRFDYSFSIKKALSYANKIGALIIFIFGEDEYNNNKISVKNLKNGKQISVTLTETNLLASEWVDFW